MKINLENGDEITIETVDGNMYTVFAYNGRIGLVRYESERQQLCLNPVEKAMVNNGDKNSAIRHVRQRLPISLVESKQLVEEYERECDLSTV